MQIGKTQEELLKQAEQYKKSFEETKDLAATFLLLNDKTCKTLEFKPKRITRGGPCLYFPVSVGTERLLSEKVGLWEGDNVMICYKDQRILSQLCGFGATLGVRVSAFMARHLGLKVGDWVRFAFVRASPVELWFEVAEPPVGDVCREEPK